MESSSLHPFDLETVHAYVAALNGAEDGLAGDDWAAALIEAARRGYDRARQGDEAGAAAVGYGLARLLAARYPSFVGEGLSLTAWEARFDRGAGMLMRPPARLFGEEGLDTWAARAMPIRLHPAYGLMGGAFVPARLVPELERRIETRLARLARRLVEAELDAVAILGLLLAAVGYARERGLGLYEGEGVVVPEEPASIPPGGRVVLADRKGLDPALRRRLEAAARPPKQPGLIARLFGRGVRPATTWPDVGENGRGR
jgi:hypothetical protein